MKPGDSAAHISVYLQRWRLSSPELIDESPASRVYRVFHRGRWAVLKIHTSATAENERRSAAMLAWYGGSGAANVYELDHEAVLMEWADGVPLSSLVTEGRDALATRIIGQTVRMLHAPRHANPPDLIPLETWIAPLFDVSNKLWPMAGRDMLVRARFIARDLLDSMPDLAPLHGDLHHDNIFFSSRSWIAVDPRGLHGDPAYEVANSFLSPWGMTDLCAEPARIERMARAFADELALSRARVLGFAAVNTALSISRDLSSGQPISHQVSVLPNLIAAYGRAAHEKA